MVAARQRPGTAPPGRGERSATLPDPTGVGRDNDDTRCEVPDADADLPDPDTGAEHDPDNNTGQCDRPVGRVRRVAGVVVPLLVGAALIAVVADMAGDIGAMVKALRAVDPAVLMVAVACEVASFAFLGLHLRALGGPEANVRRLAPFRLATVVFGLGSVMPAAPAEGLVMAGGALRHRRLARARTVLVLGVSQFFGTVGLYALGALSALTLVVSSHDAPIGARAPLVAGGIGTLAGLVALAAVLTRRRFAEFAGLIGGRLRHPRKPASAAERRRRGIAWHDAAMHVLSEQHKGPWLLVTILLGWALDGGCLFFALAAIGVRTELDVLLLAYTISAAASIIPFLPAGLGVVEMIAPAILHLYGVPIEAALAGLLVYRVVGTVLPAIVGAGALATLRLADAPEVLPEERKAMTQAATG